MIQGLLVATPTPFDNDEVADQAFAEHVASLMEAGTMTLSPCGVIGEGSTLSAEERSRLIRIAVETAGHVRR